jgi:hypothetical protein
LQNRIARTGLTEKDSVGNTARTRQTKQDCQDRTVRTGQPEWNNWHRTVMMVSATGTIAKNT